MPHNYQCPISDGPKADCPYDSAAGCQRSSAALRDTGRESLPSCPFINPIIQMQPAIITTEQQPTGKAKRRAK